MAGELQVITETPVPFGWEGWHLQLASLEKASSLSLQGCPTHLVQGYARPRLLLGEPIPGVTTPYGSPVYADPPRLWLPDTSGSAISWHVDVRPAAGGISLVSREIDQARYDRHLGWRAKAHPGSVRHHGARSAGPRDAQDDLHCRRCFGQLQASCPRSPVSGLEPGNAELRAPIGASANPARLSFGISDRAHVVELRAGAETEPVVITPPHIDLLCAGAGATHLDRRADPCCNRGNGRSWPPACPCPGTVVKADLEVWAGAQRVQTIPASGRAGSRSHRLRPASCQRDRGPSRPRRADAALGPGRHARRLRAAPAVGNRRRGQLWPAYDPRLRAGRGADSCPVPGPRAVARAGHLAGSRGRSGPASARRCVMRARFASCCASRTHGPSPTGPTGRPATPTLCDAPGYRPVPTRKRMRLSRFLAGEADLPASPRRVERLWRLIHLADDLIAVGAPANLRERCSAVLRDQPGRGADRASRRRA